MDGPNQVTLETINSLGHQIKELREIKDEHKKVLEEVNSRLRELETKFIFCLQENGMEKYVVPGYGTAYISKRLSYKVPKEQDAREAFFEHLKQKGVYESLITVHSQTLNSWAKKETEIMMEQGCDSFEIPGLGEPTYSETLGVRKS